MKVAVRYYSMTGNTKKLAEVVAATAGVDALTIDVPIEEDIDILFLGSAVYAFGVDEKVKQFVQNLDPSKVKCVVNFSTAALVPSTYSHVLKLLKDRGIKMDSREFHCRGNFKFMHKSRPNEEDFTALRAFVKNVLGQVYWRV